MNAKQIAQVVEILNGSTLAVKTAMVILLSYQTRGERAIGATVESNGKGFSHRTEHRGTYFAKWVLGLSNRSTDRQIEKAIEDFLAGDLVTRARFGNPLTGRFVEQARDIAIHHRAQLQDLLPPEEEEQLPPTVRWFAPNAVAEYLFDEAPQTMQSF